jgi:molybdate transport system substrate-binding protein
MKKELIVLLVLFSVFLAIGCTDNGNKATNNTSIPVNTSTSASEQKSEEITVSAAASLTEAFKDMEPEFETENPGVDVNFNFGSSGNLRKQIEGGAPADVFASADQKNMNTLANETLIDNSSREDFAQNSLVLIVPVNSTLNITGVKDLTDSKVEKIGVGNPDTVPVGNYTRTAMTEAGLWNQLESKAVFAEDVKSVLTYVEGGDVDAGFVYMSDAMSAKPGTIKIVTNVSVSTPVKYPIATVSYSKDKKDAQKFIDFVAGAEGQKILQNYGFKSTSQQ